MIVEKKNVTCESNAVSVYSSRLYCRGVRLERYIAIFVGESVFYATVFTRFTVI